MKKPRILLETLYKIMGNQLNVTKTRKLNKCRILILTLIAVLLISYMVLRATVTVEAAFSQVMNVSERATLLETAVLISSMLDKQNVTHYMCGGTLLGSWRHHGYIPWDDDIDFCILISGKERMEKMESLFKKLEPEYTLYKEYSMLLQMDEWKFYSHKHTNPMLYKTFRWPYIDLFFMYEDDTHIWERRIKTHKYPKSVVFPLTKRPFEDQWLWAPKDTEGFLTCDWDITKCVSREYDHKNELPTYLIKTLDVPCTDLKHVPLVYRTREELQVIESLYIGDKYLHNITIPIDKTQKAKNILR